MTAGRETLRAQTAGDADRPARARFTFAAVASVFVGCLVIQVFLVGLDVFADASVSIHRDFAYVYGWLTPVLVLLAGFARAPKSTRDLTIVLVVLFSIQVVLPSLRDVFPILAALHSINALAIFGIAVVVASRAIALFRGTSAEQATG